MSEYEVRNAVFDKMRERRRERFTVATWIRKVSGWRRWLRYMAASPVIVTLVVVLVVMWTARLPLLALAWIGHWCAAFIRRYYGWDYLP